MLSLFLFHRIKDFNIAYYKEKKTFAEKQSQKFFSQKQKKVGYVISTYPTLNFFIQALQQIHRFLQQPYSQEPQSQCLGPQHRSQRGQIHGSGHPLQ